MIVNISITDDFNQINAEYKKFKANTFRNWCEASELSIQDEEKNLIKSINSILQISENYSDEIIFNKLITEDDLIRALIGARTLSKYSILNQDKCVRFFSIIEANLFQSIHKRRFFIKCVVKESKNNTQYIWDEFIKYFKNKMLHINSMQDDIESIKDSLIYISFLIQYAPDFVRFYSSEIFSRLFQIIQTKEAKYALDFNYDILSYTNETLDTYFDTRNNNEKYYGNFAIELFQTIIEKVDSKLSENINIDKILSMKLKIKKQATLTVVFDKCPKILNGKIESIYNELSEVNEKEGKWKCLLIRNLIYYSTISDDCDPTFFQSLFSIDEDEDSILICGKLQNIKLFIQKNPDLLNSLLYENNQDINPIILNSLNGKDMVLTNALDLLNTYCSYIDDYSLIDPNIINTLMQLKLPTKYISIIDLMIEIDPDKFIQNLQALFANDALESFKFLYNMINESKEMTENVINLINNLPNEQKAQIEKDVFNFTNDPEIKSLVPFVASTLFPNKFFSHNNLKDLFHILLCDQSNNVKLSIIRFFREEINKEVIKNYDLSTILNETTTNSIFKILIGDFSNHELQIEAMKLLCKLHQLDQDLNFNNIITTYLDFFKSFSKESTTNDFNYENFTVLLNSLSYIYDMLSYIFESYPDYCQKYFLPYFNFTIDFINCAVTKKNYKNRSKLLPIEQPKTLLQYKFYQEAFCSSLNALQTILKTNPNIVRPYFSQIIVLCTNILQEKIGQKETQSIIVLLDKIFDKMELQQVIEIQEKNNINNLYTIIFKAGTQFISPIISEHVFRILGFLGAQNIYEKAKPIYADFNDKNRFYSEFVSQLMEFDRNKTPDNIYYVICSNYIFKIFEEENTEHSHFFALEAFIKILSIAKTDIVCTHFSHCLQYFNFLLNESGIQNKKIFVPLFRSLIDATKNIINKVDHDQIQNYICQIIQIFEKLQDYDLSDTIIPLTVTFKTELIPFLAPIKQYVQNLQNEEKIIDLFYNICENCYTRDSDITFKTDIIQNLIQSAENGNYSILQKLSLLLSKMPNLANYIRSIVRLCINCIREKKNANILEDAIDLLINLKANINDKTVDYFNRFVPSINQVLIPYPFQKRCFKMCKINQPTDTTEEECTIDQYEPLFAKNFDISSFVNILKKIIKNKTDQTFIQQCFFELKHLCTTCSPNLIMSCVLKILKNSNKYFENLIFYASLHSWLQYLNINNKDIFIEAKKIIKEAILIILPKSPPDLHATLTNLIEFLDRCGFPIVESTDFPPPITSYFSNKPPISLWFALLNFEKRIPDSHNDLQLAYLNTGMLDKYQQFTRTLEKDQEFSKKFILQIDNNYRLPIFTGSIEDRRHLEKANSLFIEHFDDADFMTKFDQEINQIQHKVISHIFKAAALIKEFLKKDQDQEELREIISAEIDQGFQSLGIEDGPRFSHGFTSVLQSIVYAQQLNELKEMMNTNSEKKNFELRFKDSNSILSFLPPVLLLRIDAKGNYKDSLLEKLQLLSLCRKSNRWDLMKNYSNFFGFNDNDNSPPEVQYEIMHYKIANNEATDQDFNSLIAQLTNAKTNEKLGEEYNVPNMIKTIKYQQALHYLHMPKNINNYEKIISLCNEVNNAESTNILGLIIMRMFESTTDKATKISLLNNAIRYYSKAAIENDKVRISNLLLINHLLFTYYNHDENSTEDIKADIKDVKDDLEKIPPHLYIDIISNIISYIPTLKNNDFRDFLLNMLQRVVVNCPEGVIYDYTLSIFCDKRKSRDTREIIESPIKDVMDRITQEDVKKYFEEAIDLTKHLNWVNNNIFRDSKSIIQRIKRLAQSEGSRGRKLPDDEFDDLMEKSLKFYKNDYILYFDSLHEEMPQYKIATSSPLINDIFNFYLKDFGTLKNTIFSLEETLSSKRELNGKLDEVNKQIDDSIRASIYEGIAELYQKKSAFENQIRSFAVKIDTLVSNLVVSMKKLNSVNLKLDKSNELFVHSMKLNQTTNLKLPVFGTFHYKEKTITIQKFQSEYTEMSSVAKPKKIEIIGSDGHSYTFLLKNTEDLRNDQRIMIFFKFMNQFLKTKIRTYSVVPLTSKFGIMQFVQNMSGIIGIVESYRKKLEEKLDSPVEEKDTIVYAEACVLKDVFRKPKLSAKDSVNLFNVGRIQALQLFQEMCKRTPERANDLRESFWSFCPNSESWLKFVNNYTVSCAVTSIVGYVLGLGDRHLNNIMISKDDGYIMHIDFCDTFEKNQIRTSFPERVPFRLTRNFVSAFGPCKCDGTFRICCEECLTVVRNNRDQIMNLLSVFITSPLQSNEVRTMSLVRNESEIESVQDEMKYKMERVMKKVSGTDYPVLLSDDAGVIERYIERVTENEVRRENMAPLSVHDQVERLIEVATDEYNLACAYRGWTPWI